MAEQQNECILSKVILQVNADNQAQDDKCERKVKRVLHFSDGDIVEYDDNANDTTKDEVEAVVMNPKDLQWLPWTWHQTAWFSSKILGGCDYVGEALADFFGITSPKYKFEIDEYHRQQKTMAAEREKEQLQMAGWTSQERHDVINISQPATKL